MIGSLGNPAEHARKKFLLPNHWWLMYAYKSLLVPTTLLFLYSTNWKAYGYICRVRFNSDQLIFAMNLRMNQAPLICWLTMTLLAFSSSEGYIVLLYFLKKKTKQHQQKRMIPNFVCSVGFNQPLLTFPIDTLIAKLHFWYWKIQDISNNQLHLSRLLRLMPLGMKEIWSYLVTSLLSLLARLFDRRKVKVVINEL